MVHIKFAILTIFKYTISSHAFLRGFGFEQVADFGVTNVMTKMTKPDISLTPSVILSVEGP